MTEHLHIERVSALLDEPWSDLAAEQHLEVCEECRLEFERLSRMRMAFSALGELEAPRDQWDRIEASLEDALAPGGSGIIPISSRAISTRLMRSGLIQAAAALALFAGGILAGLQFTGSPAGAVSDGSVVAGNVLSVIPATGDDRDLYNALFELESMQTPLRQVQLGSSGGNAAPAGFDPLAAAQAAARLDGIIRALQERLDESPGDPFASGYLPWALDQRARLAAMVERSARSSSMVEW
ncbi:MAG: hypothetical protein ACC682_10000 [Gemmatimonadota bacterium]